jgi:hypothetical protein
MEQLFIPSLPSPNLRSTPEATLPGTSARGTPALAGGARECAPHCAAAVQVSEGRQRQQFLQYLLIGQVRLPPIRRKDCLIESFVRDIKPRHGEAIRRIGLHSKIRVGKFQSPNRVSPYLQFFRSSKYNRW